MPPPDQADATLRFAVEVDGTTIADFATITGLVLEREVIESTQVAPDGTKRVRKLPGRWKSGDVTLTRGLTSDQSVTSWMKTHAEGKGTPGRVTITAFAADGTPVARYHLEQAWPAKLEIGALAAGVSGVVTESVTLAYERLEIG